MSPTTAAGGDPTGLTVVNDCPRSLGGSERVARTIKKACGPITVTGSYTVEGKLTLEPGVVLKFEDGSWIDVGPGSPAKLIVNGTDKEPVVMTSAGSSAPGAWAGVRISHHAAPSQLTGLVIENAGDSNGALNVSAPGVTLKGTTIRNAKEIGLVVADGGRFAEMSGNTFEKAGKIAISVEAPAVGDLGPSKFDQGAVVQVRGAIVSESAKWQNLGVPYAVSGDLDLRAKVELAAGVELRMRGSEIRLGGDTGAMLVAVGTADQPVVFTSDDKAPGAWKGIVLYSKSEVRLDHAKLAYGGADKGVLVVDEGGIASVTDTTFEGNQRGVVVRHTQAKLKAFDHNKLSASPEPALTIRAQHVANVGADNAFDKEAHIQVIGDDVTQSATWNAQSVALDVTDIVRFGDGATLTLQPGIELTFAAGSGLEIGTYNNGALVGVGTADKPIKLRAQRQGVVWKGISLSSRSSCELAHVQIADVSAAGITADDGTVAKLSDVSCARCAEATVKATCRSQLTVSRITAEAGTPKAESKPACK